MGSEWHAFFPNHIAIDMVACKMLDELVLLFPIPTDRGVKTRWEWMFLCKKAGLITGDEYRYLVLEAHKPIPNVTPTSTI